jgi:protein-S-isoprenylcysteine O-methyltransferase Ste14
MAQASERTPLRLAIAAGGGLAFGASLVYFGYQYAIGFDTRTPPDSAVLPAAINAGLFTVFALHHSVFARTGLKARLARVFAPELERSAYVWIASALFLLVCAGWQEVPGVLWETHGATAWLLRGWQVAGAIFTLVAARHLDVLDLAGIRQALHLPLNRRQQLDERGPYGLVRHPIYLAWLFLVWPAPLMNGTRLTFAAISTLYVVAAIPFEERDLHRTFGTAYRQYADRVRFKILPGIY